MREINNIVIHCTATDQTATVEAIQRYWREVLGWKNPGYHFIIEADGKIHQLQPIEKLANGVRGHNSDSIHIAYIGGRYADDRTQAQQIAIKTAAKILTAVFPNARILGHRDFPGVVKACPRFDVSNM